MKKCWKHEDDEDFDNEMEWGGLSGAEAGQAYDNCN